MRKERALQLVRIILIWLGQVLSERSIFSFQEALKKAEREKERQPPERSEEEKITLLKYDGLEREIAVLLRLYYSKDGYKRILFYQHKGHITVFRERLTLFDEEELCYSTCYGV